MEEIIKQLDELRAKLPDLEVKASVDIRPNHKIVWWIVVNGDYQFGSTFEEVAKAVAEKYNINALDKLREAGRLQKEAEAMMDKVRQLRHDATKKEAA